MQLRLAIGAGLLAIAGLALAGPQVGTTRVGTTATADDAPAGPAGRFGLEKPLEVPAELEPRTPKRKIPTAKLTLPVNATGEIVVKFKDLVRARIGGGGARVESTTGLNIAPARAIMQQFDLTAETPFPGWNDARFAALEARAATRSGRQQPDLGGVVLFEGPMGNLEAAAKAFNELDSVEFVQFRQQWRPYYPGPTEACCLDNGSCTNLTPSACLNLNPQGTPMGPGTDCDSMPPPNCVVGACCPMPGEETCIEDLLEQDCIDQGGEFQGSGTICEDVDCTADNDCGTVADNCFEVHNGAFCGAVDGDEGACCNLVCDILPRCCDVEAEAPIWDDFCVWVANAFCIPACVGPPPGTPDCADRCTVGFNESCFETHGLPGCIDGGCCLAVCAQLPTCCNNFWAAECVTLANALCVSPQGSGPTPSFTAQQGHLRFEPYVSQAGGAPSGLQFPAPSTNGYTGEGWNVGGPNYALWVINEVHADVDPTQPPTLPNGDANNDGVTVEAQDEFVEIVNNHLISRNITGWELQVNGVTRHVFPANTVVPAAGAIVIFGGGTPTGTFGGAVVQTASSGALLLPSPAATLTLLDASGRTVTTLAYTGADVQASITRFPDVTATDGGFVDHSTIPVAPEPCDADGDCPTVNFATFCNDPAVDGDPQGSCVAPYSPGLTANPEPFTPSKLGLYGLSRELFEDFGFGETDPPGSADFDDLVANARGRGVKVGVIEWSFFAGHEDLDVTIEPGQTIVPIQENVPNHATACLGIINAQDNGFGVTGIAPEADAFFFPLFSVEEAGRFEAAFLAAYEQLDFGDVVSCSFGPGEPILNLNNEPLANMLITVGTDVGITTCVAAGNDCEDLGGAENQGDSGAIVVGAGQPGFPWCRLTFSNYFTTEGNPDEDSNIIHTQAWGSNVTTTGYGALFNPTGDPNRMYTNGFNGTSAATPQIAGLVACLQGLSRQLYGIPVSPRIVRAAIGHGAFLQCQILDPDDLPGFPSELDCGPNVDPDSGPNRIENYPDPARGDLTASRFIIDFPGFDDSPLVEDIQVLTGTLLQGNHFSIKGSDDNYLIIQSALTNPSTPGAGSRGDLGFGQVTDLLVTARPSSGFVNQVTVTTESKVTGGTGIVLLYLFDYDFNQWLVGGVGFLVGEDIDPGVDQLLTFPLTNASRFVGPDGVVRLRLWTISLGVDGPYQVWHDWINFTQGGGTPFVPGG